MSYPNNYLDQQREALNDAIEALKGLKDSLAKVKVYYQQELQAERQQILQDLIEQAQEKAQAERGTQSEDASGSQESESSELEINTNGDDPEVSKAQTRLLEEMRSRNEAEFG
jgi:hypothetical protein